MPENRIRRSAVDVFNEELGNIIEDEYERFIDDQNNYAPTDNFSNEVRDLMSNWVNDGRNLNFDFIDQALRSVYGRRGQNLQQLPPIEMIATVYDVFFYTLDEVVDNYPSMQNLTAYLATLLQSEFGRSMVPHIAANYIAHYEEVGRPHAYMEIEEFLRQNNFDIDDQFIRNCNLPEEIEHPGSPNFPDYEILAKRSRHSKDEPDR